MTCRTSRRRICSSISRLNSLPRLMRWTFILRGAVLAIRSWSRKGTLGLVP
ncbi:hypothetical protein EMPG_14897 [Blastomyces silverae]|uniref:Uncharacterized protein n=1 Tax=Blastomyces silverae TaxID=2060906 RepID=A0A0H1BKG5_9EURO|nr:hypothetical protein EMPG_14897 [Blastomyces silverae]